MNDTNSEKPAPTDDEMERNVLDHMTQQYRLSENLPDSTRKHSLSLVKRLMVSRRTRYERKYQRQFELQAIRQEVWMIRSTNNDAHPGLADMLDSLESSIELDFDSMKKGYIDR